MTLEDYNTLWATMSVFVLCGDCICYDKGICSRLKVTNVECDEMLMCNECDGCTFGVRKDDKNDNN